MSNAELPDQVIRFTIIRYCFWQECLCSALTDAAGDTSTCSRCRILRELRDCWPSEYIEIVEDIAQEAVRK